MTNVVVTGGAGFIGSHTCKALAGRGILPIAYDNLSSGSRAAVKWGPLEVGDILDRNRLKGVLEEYRPTAVIHFAAFAYVGESVFEPLKYYRNNVAGTVSVLEAMQEAGVQRIVFSSSCATYGIPPGQLIVEETPQNPINPYGWSKLMGEQILRDAKRAFDIEFVSLRYFNAAGADPDGEVGENHDPETHLIPLAIDAACGRTGPLRIFGDDYDTADGTCVRDYVHVSDIAHAHVLALEWLEQRKPSRAFNLGNGSGFSVREVLSITEEVVGSAVPHSIAPRRVGDPAILVADASLAKEALGWSPVFSDLPDIIRTAWWWRRGAERDVRAKETERSL